MGPRVCILDPYCDIAGHLARSGRGRRHADWHCFHTELWSTRVGGVDIGVVTMAMGAAWAVLVAERLVASGCRVVLSIGPALPVDPPGELPCVVLIDRALRREAVSRLPAARWSRLDATVSSRLSGAFDDLAVRVRTGASWSAAAPFRVPATTAARADHDHDRISCVETDAAALYASDAARSGAVVSLAHLAATTVTTGRDVAWGPGVGAEALLAVGVAAAVALDGPGGSPMGGAPRPAALDAHR